MRTIKPVDPRPIARALHAEEGFSTHRIGRVLGVSAMTVWRWLDEENAEADRRRVRAARERRAEEERELAGAGR